MDALLALKEFDIISWIIILFAILTAIVAIYEIIGKVSVIIGKPVKWIKKKDEDHELLVQTSKNLAELQERHKTDVEQSIIHDKRIKDELSTFMDEMRKSMADTQIEIKQFAENRVRDRQQSFEIQKSLTDSIKNIGEVNALKEKQIDSLMNAQRELLADKINQKYKYYISIEGIPEDELDEFKNLHFAYKECGGNHSGDAKYEYCMNHLRVIPVETKLVFDKQ